MSGRLRIASIVEGEGELEAVPVLIHRIAEIGFPALPVQALSPLRVPRHRLIKTGELERATELAAREVGGQGGLVVLLDSDDDCPAELGPALRERVRQTRRDLPATVVLAKREYECWFLAAAPSLRTVAGLPAGVEAPPDPEAVRGGKEWLTQQRQGSQAYNPVLEQAKFTRQMSFEEARRAPSFDRCWRELHRLLAECSIQCS